MKPPGAMTAWAILSWFAGNEHLAFFQIDRHRSAEVAKSIFGDHFAGTLVRDRYAAYNGIGVDWQACLAHILTKAKDIRAEHALLPPTEQDPATGPFCDRVRDLCARLCEAGQQAQIRRDPLDRRRPRWKNGSSRELNSICKQALRFKPAETLRTYLAGPEQKSLFTFLRRPGVPPTNNHAEQSLRHLVIFRKICVRNPIGKRTENPQHPSQPGANRQKTRRPPKGVSAHPPHRRYRHGSSCAV